MGNTNDSIRLDNLTEKELEEIKNGDLIPAVKIVRYHAPILDLAAAREVVKMIRAGKLNLLAGKNVCPTCRGVGFVHEPNAHLSEVEKRLETVLVGNLKASDEIALLRAEKAQLQREIAEVEKREELLLNVLIWIRNRTNDESPYGPAHVVQMVLEYVTAVMAKSAKE